MQSAWTLQVPSGTDICCMNEGIRIFIPAAGRGERLRPITDHIPKPLVPLLGKPAIQLVMEAVAPLRIDGMGVNLHHKREAVQAWVQSSAFASVTQLFPEEQLLGTGGALKNAEPFLKAGDFLVHNADVISDIDLAILIEHHRRSGNIATLAVHDYAEFNSLLVDEEGALAGLVKKGKERTGSLKKRAFTGIAVYSPGLLDFIPEGVSHIVDAWQRAVREGYRIGTVDFSGCEWTDIGTPGRYAAAVFSRLRKEGESVYIHPSATGCESAGLGGNVVLEEGACIKGPAALGNCIVLPGSVIEEGERVEGCIKGPGFRVDIGTDGEGNGKHAIGSGGSDRRFYRISRGGRMVVLVEYEEAGSDYRRHIEYTRFLESHHVPVPALVSTEEESASLTVEDLGDLSLYSWMQCRRSSEDVEAMYRRVLDIALQLHHEVSQKVDECPAISGMVFDYAHFRWETSYFMERFVRGLLGVAVSGEAELEDEFERLARESDSFAKTVIHRDFQAQNIMVTEGGRPGLIDFQGARLGPAAYDIASLLWDPYVRLEDELRDGLLDYYMQKSIAMAPGGQDGEDFRRALICCRLQRHMQALGAYGFLSGVKGKRYFLKHVPEAVRLLREDIEETGGEFPVLDALAGNIQRLLMEKGMLY